MYPLKISYTWHQLIAAKVENLSFSKELTECLKELKLVYSLINQWEFTHKLLQNASRSSINSYYINS